LLLAGAAAVAAVVGLGVPALRSDYVATPTSQRSPGASTTSQGTSVQKGSPLVGSGRVDRGTEGAALPRLSTASFQSDVRRLLTPNRPFALPPTPDSARSPSAASALPCALGTPAAGVTQQRLILLDGRPAALEVFRSRGGARLVRAVSCDGIETLASTTIPAR
ncbi:MAG: hypothetical protein M3Y66_05740, partial [Actinomycetota bacterium]|nr:hypothetical protein [Actinomycetota bacterium]